MNTEDFEKKGAETAKKEARPKLPKENEIQNILDQLRTAFEADVVIPAEDANMVPKAPEITSAVEAETAPKAPAIASAVEAETAPKAPAIASAVESATDTEALEIASATDMAKSPQIAEAVPAERFAFGDDAEELSFFGGAPRPVMTESLAEIPPAVQQVRNPSVEIPAPAYRPEPEKEDISPLQERLRALRRLHEEYMYSGEMENKEAETEETPAATPEIVTEEAAPLSENTDTEEQPSLDAVVAEAPIPEEPPKTEFSEAAACEPVFAEPVIHEVPEPTMESVRKLLETTFFGEDADSDEDPAIINERTPIEAEFPQTEESEDAPDSMTDEDYEIAERGMGDTLPSGVGHREYVSHNQNEEITANFEKGLRFTLLRLILVAVLSTVLFISENIYLLGLQIPALTTDLGIRGLSILLNLQIFFLILLLCYPYLIKGARAILHGNLTTEASALFVALVIALYDVVLYIWDAPSPRMISFAGAVYFLLLTVFDFMQQNNDFMSFKLVSTTARKTVVVTSPLSRFSAECEAAVDLVGDGRALYSEPRRAGFVEGFFTRSAAREDDRKGSAVLLLSLLFSLVMFALSYFFLDKTLIENFSVLIFSFVSCMPAMAFFLRPLALSLLVKRAVLGDSAIVGEYSALEYAGTRVLSFEDTDAFPPKNVKVKGIKLFGENRLDRVLCQVSVLFQKIGGPLSGVFGNLGKPTVSLDDVSLLSVRENGISARVGGDNLLLGSGEFMEENGVTLYYDSEDTRQTDTGKISILYIAENGVVSARFYLQYIPSPAFEETAKRLYEEKVFVVLHSFDPNINERLLEKVSYVSEYAVRVVRKTPESLASERRPRLNSGIVTTARRENLIGLFFAALRLKRLFSHDFRFVVLAITALLFGGLLFAGGYSFLSSAFVGLYQLFWLIPTWLVTKIFLREK